MTLPNKIKWLEGVGPLPKLVIAALNYLGLREYPGVTSNPIIMQMAKELGIANIYTNDDISWCALFISYLCHITGKPMPFKSWDIVRAASYLKWGNEVKKGDEKLGDIVVKSRVGGNHVAIILAETEKTFQVIGGNQSNSVSITEIKKSDVIGVRRYYATNPPDSVKKYVVNSSGVLSTNEV